MEIDFIEKREAVFRNAEMFANLFITVSQDACVILQSFYGEQNGLFIASLELASG
jgi:hypothetical protein